MSELLLIGCVIWVASPGTIDWGNIRTLDLDRGKGVSGTLSETTLLNGTDLV